MLGETKPPQTDDADRSSVSEYYRAPILEDEARTSRRDPGPSEGKRMCMVTGLILLICAIVANFASFSVGVVVFDPENPLQTEEGRLKNPDVTSADVDTVIEATAPVRLTQGLFSMVFSAISLLGMFGAIGAMRRKRSGRILVLGWASAAVVFIVAETVTHYAYVFPLYRQIQEGLRSMCGPPCLELLDDVCGLSTAAGPYGLPILQALSLVAPVVYLIIFTRASATKACQR